MLLHYFFLSTFTWMLAEGLHLYSMVIKVFGSEDSKHLYYYGIGWGRQGWDGAGRNGTGQAGTGWGRWGWDGAGGDGTGQAGMGRGRQGWDRVGWGRAGCDFLFIASFFAP